MVSTYFLPTYRKHNLLFAQKILSISLRDGTFLACLAHVSNSKTIVLNAAAIPCPKEDASHYLSDSQIAAIKETLSSFGSYDQCVITESSEYTVFKELELPFSTRNQIDLVLSEELEPQLPFNPEEGYSGFVINNTRPDGTSSVITATLKKGDFDVFVAPLEGLGLRPNSVAVETEGIASLISALYPPTDTTQPLLHIIVEFRATFTQLIFVHNGVLKGVKNIPFGKNFLYHQSALTQKTPPQEIAETDPQQEPPALQPQKEPLPAPREVLDAERHIVLIDKIIFACDALAYKYSSGTANETFFFLNPQIPKEELVALLKNKTDRNMECFEVEKIEASSVFSCAKNCPPFDWKTLCPIIGGAYLQRTDNHIELPVEGAQETLFSQIKKNILIAGIIFMSIVGTTAAFGYRQLSSLNRVLQVAESAQLSKLKDKFPEQLEDQGKLTLKRAISLIDEYVKEQQISWNMLGAKSLSPLTVLYELTQLFDRRLFTIDISRVVIVLSEDDHVPLVTVDGTFMSKTEAHYSDFGILEKHLALSKHLVLTKDVESSFDDTAHGVKFTAHFKLRDQ